MKNVRSSRHLLQIALDLFCPALEIHVSHVLFYDLLYHVAVLTIIYLRHRNLVIFVLLALAL